MNELHSGMWNIAEDMAKIIGREVAAKDCYELVAAACQSFKSQYGEEVERIDPEVILQILRKQMGELVRFGRAKKLLAKRKNVAPDPSRMV